MHYRYRRFLCMETQNPKSWKSENETERDEIDPLVEEDLTRTERRSQRDARCLNAPGFDSVYLQL
jgi:hypothetical protein